MRIRYYPYNSGFFYTVSPRVYRKRRELRSNNIYSFYVGENIQSCAGQVSFSTYTPLFKPDSDNDFDSQSGNENSNSDNDSDLQSDNENSGGNSGNSSPSQDDGSGYETDSNRSYFEEGTDAMVECPVRDIPDDQLRRYIRDTEEIVQHPIEVVEPNDPWATEIIQSYIDRHAELRDELERRQREGLASLPDSSESESTTNAEEESAPDVNQEPESTANDEEESTPGVGKEAEDSAKRKFDSDSDSSTQPSKKFRQDTSDITGETEPFDFCGGDD
ncbi:MAG: hypothetical protein ACXVHV_08710 [Methanobacterium sp.]